MTDKTDTHRDAVLNTLRSTSITGIAAYVGLISTGTTELTGNAYARQLAGFGAPGAGGGGRQIANSAEILFPVATPSDWSTANRFGVYSAVSGGDLLYAKDLPVPRTALAGDQIRFAAAALTVTET